MFTRRESINIIIHLSTLRIYELLVGSPRTHLLTQPRTVVYLEHVFIRLLVLVYSMCQ